MSSSAPVRARRWPKVLAALFILLVVLLIAAYFGAGRLLKRQIEAALGPRAEVGSIELGWDGVEIRNLRVRAAPKSGWPAEDEFRAERVRVVPQLRALFSGEVRVSRIAVEGGYLSMLRSRNGRLRVLPALLEVPAPRGGEAAGSGGLTTEVLVGEVVLSGAAVEFFDETVRRPALRIRLEGIDASLDDLRLPSLAGQSRLSVRGRIKGAQRDGNVDLAGKVVLATRESDLKLKLRGVDLVSLQPYLIKASETGVKRGSLDLDLHSTVHRRQLHAPGTLVLSDLELAPAGSFGTFMGMPQQLVVAALKDRNGRIDVEFALNGNIDDPKFSLNESFAIRVAAAVGQSLGVSIESLAKGVGSVGTGTVKGLGEALGKIFGQ